MEDKEYLNGMYCRSRLMIYKDEMVLGPGVVRLLELVKETQSLSQSCRQMGMAYSKAWKLIKKAEEGCKVQLMFGVRGGKNGGSTKLTKEGEELLQKYRTMEAEMHKAMDDIFEKVFMEKE